MAEDLEKRIKEIMHSLSPEAKFEKFFNEEYPNQWQKMSKVEKDSIIAEIVQYLGNPSKVKEIENLLEKTEDFENKKSDIMILFLGVILGVSGNLVANLIDKYFSYLGWMYDIAVVVFFIACSWIVYDFFVGKKGKEIENKENSIEISKIINKVGNYK